MRMPAAVQEHKGGKPEAANFPLLPPHPWSPRRTRKRKDNKACTGGAASSPAIATRGAPLPRYRARAPERGRRQDRGGWGRGSPTLSSTKSQSRGRRRWPLRVLADRCPIAAWTGTRGNGGAGWLPRRLTMANGGCSLRPWAPRLLPAGACCLCSPPAPAPFRFLLPGSSRNVPGAAVL